MKRRWLLWVTVLIGSVQTAWAQDAGVDCSTLSNPLYIPGTTVAKPYFARIGPKLAAIADGGQITFVYQGKGSCAALNHVTPGGPMTGTASYWVINPIDGGNLEQTCNLPIAGITADMAVGDVSIRTCTGADTPPGFGDFSSFVEPFGFIVPPNSQQTAITAEEAYFILKFGGQTGYQVPPWIDPNFIVIRNTASSTQLTIGMNVGILGTMWSASLTNQNAGGGNVLTKVAAENTTGNADKTLGILATDTWDPNRDKVKMLAFQAFKQGCLGAVYPDSTITAFDKVNVRDGHYPIWGTFWSYSAIDGTSQPANPRAKTLIAFFSGTALLGTADPIVDVAKTGNIPQCAMKVKRASDGAPITPATPANPCNCFYESLVSTTACTACPAGTCSGTGVCRYGYCEAR